MAQIRCSNTQIGMEKFNVVQHLVRSLERFANEFTEKPLKTEWGAFLASFAVLGVLARTFLLFKAYWGPRLVSRKDAKNRKARQDQSNQVR